MEQLNPFYDSNVNEPYFSLEEPELELDHAQNQGLTQTPDSYTLLTLPTKSIVYNTLFAVYIKI